MKKITSKIIFYSIAAPSLIIIPLLTPFAFFWTVALEEAEKLHNWMDDTSKDLRLGGKKEPLDDVFRNLDKVNSELADLNAEERKELFKFITKTFDIVRENKDEDKQTY